MAELLINPIDMKTTGGYDARITGIDPGTSDFIVGTVGPKGHPAHWDKSGFCRDNASECNFDMRDPVMEDLLATAQALGVKIEG